MTIGAALKRLGWRGIAGDRQTRIYSPSRRSWLSGGQRRIRFADDTSRMMTKAEYDRLRGRVGEDFFESRVLASRDSGGATTPQRFRPSTINVNVASNASPVDIAREIAWQEKTLGGRTFPGAG
jgi:hypothetical protein